MGSGVLAREDPVGGSVLFPAPMPLEESCPEGSAARLKDEQRALRELICKEHDKIARGLSLREFLADLWNYQHREEAHEKVA